MTTTRSRSRRSQDSSGSPAAQQDEADIVAEVGAELDDDSGELRTDERSVLEAGAVDAESVRENRRLQNIVNQKRAGKKDVPFNAGDLLTKYDWLIKYWPPNTLDIGVKRLTGTPIQHIITTRPKSAAELYGELMKLHGQCEEAKYEIKIVDNNSKEFRGSGHIVLLDTRPQQGQGQPMSAPTYQYPPPGYSYPAQPGQQPWHPQQPQAPQQPPPGYPPQGAPPQQGVPPQAQPQQPDPQQQPQQGAPQQPPTQVFVPPPPMGPDPMAMMTQMFDMFNNMRTSLAQQQPQQPAQQPPPPMPPPPPAHADPATMMQWMQQVFDMVQQMRPQQQPAQPGSAQSPQPQSQNPMAGVMGMMGAPPMTPPPGTIWVPGFGFMPLEKLAQVFGGGGGSGAASFGGPHRPPYSSGGAHGPPAPYTPPSPPAPPKSAAEQFKEAVSVVRTAVDAVQQVNALLPQQQGGATTTAVATAPVEDDDSPVQIIDTGPAKLVVDKKDGTLRTWETGWANMKGIMDWVAEQREAIQKANAGQTEEEEEEPKQLPPGYVEVKEGYQPPPGMVAVPVDPSQIPPVQPQPQQQQAPPQQGLPPPPANTPPPLQSTPPPNRTWEMPAMPTEEKG